MPTKESFVKVLQELKKVESEKKDKINFNQTVDLIINLKDYDLKRYSLNLFVNLPHKVKDKKVAGFLEKKSTLVDSITKQEFEDFKDKKKLKRLVKEYDFFIASAKLMPLVASTFGRVLGPTGKMPTPQMGVLMTDDENTLKELLKKIDSVVKVRAKEPSLKIAIGKQSDKEENIAENAMAVFNEVYKNLPKNKENLRSILVKYTMSKPMKVAI
jgi:large subunit ribosomal protein L1